MEARTSAKTFRRPLPRSPRPTGSKRDGRKVSVDRKLSVHKFIESDVILSPEQFLEQYGDALPQLVCVSHGQYGMFNLDTFSLGQVMLVHSYGTQSRVVTRDARGRTFSIPTDYPLKFKVIKSRTNELEEQSLSEILEEHSLPVQVRFSVPDTATFYIGPDLQIAKDILNMVLADTYQETYMLANCLNTGQLDEKTVLVPVYLKDATLSLVTGIEGKSQMQWEEYHSGLLEQMKNIKVDIKIGNQDIAFLPAEREKEVCAHIQRRSWLKVTGEEQDTYNELFFEDVDIYNCVNEDVLDDRKPPLPNRSLKESQKPSKLKASNQSSFITDSQPSESGATQGTSHFEDDSHHYAIVPPRRRLSPFRYLKKKLGFKTARSQMDKEPRRKEDCTSKLFLIEELTISELGQVLRELRLDNHVIAFKERQIDGLIAQELDKDVLKDELGFSSFEAIKFLKFTSTGHIPK